MKKLMFIVFLFISVLTLSACNSSTETASNDNNKVSGSDTIKIAGIFSSSGVAASLGEPALETLKMVVENQNKEGGIDGKKVEVIYYDDKSDQNEAVLAMKKAITQDKVSLVIGGTTSGNALAMLPLAEQYQVPYISTGSSYKIYQNEDGSSREWVFKLPPNDSHSVEKILQYLKKNGLTKIAWLNVSNSFGTGAHTEFKKMASDYGIEAVIEDEFEATVNDAKPMLTRVKKEDPQAIVVFGTVQESAVVIKNIRELSIDIPIIGSHGIGSEKLIQLAGDAANGVLFPSGKVIVADQLQETDPQKEVLLKYKKMYEDKYNKAVNLFGANTWDVFYMLKEAVENTKSSDSKDIKEYLENNLGQFIGINGIYEFTPKNHNGLTAESALVMVEIKDGNWTLGE